MNSSAESKIVLDSTYILPILGIEVEDIEEALIILRKLSRNRETTFYYTEYNIIEILGKISKVDYDSNTVDRGLSLVQDEFKLIYPAIEGYIKALELKKKGFKDLIDLLLYTTSTTRNLIFLTRDDKLINFLERQGEDTGNIIYEDEFIKKYGI